MITIKRLLDYHNGHFGREIVIRQVVIQRSHVRFEGRRWHVWSFSDRSERLKRTALWGVS